MSVPPSNRSNVSSFIVMDLLRAAAEKDKQLVAKGSTQRVLHLEIGQPSTGAPSKVRDAAAQALTQDKLGYTDAFGVMPLRAKIAESYMTRYGISVQPQHIITTTGSSGAFVVGFLAAFDAGMRVAMASPGYPCYRNILQALGVEVVELPVSDATNWQPTVAMLEGAASQGPLHGLIIASPSNPTGTVLSEEELRSICDFCTRRKVRLISDEIYHGITLTLAASTALAFKKDAMVINSFSKYYSMTGWRLGWIVCQDEALRSRLESLLQNLFISAPTLSQIGGSAAFACTEELETHVQRYKQNMRVLVQRLPLCGFAKLSSPQGAFYLYCDVTDLLQLTGCKDSMALANLLLDTCAVALTPGIDFDPTRGGKYLRFSFAGATKDMEAACDRLQHWYTVLRGKRAAL